MKLENKINLETDPVERQMGKESDVTERLLVIGNKILYTACNYINPQINDILTFEPAWVPTEKNIKETYYLVETAMEDFIEYEREIQLGGVPETGSDDTGRGKEIFEAMREIDESYSGKIAAGRITIQRQYITSVRDNRFFPKTARTGTDKRKALHVHDAGSGTDTRTDSSGSGKNSSTNEGESKGKVDTKPQLSIDKKHSDWDVCLTKEEQAMFCSKIGEIKQGKAAQFHESSLSRLRRQRGKETEVRMLVVNNKIIYTDGDYINPQINDVLTFEPVSKITR